MGQITFLFVREGEIEEPREGAKLRAMRVSRGTAKAETEGGRGRGLPWHPSMQITFMLEEVEEEWRTSGAAFRAFYTFRTADQSEFRGAFDVGSGFELS